MTPLLSVDEARTRLFAMVTPLRMEQVPLREATGRWAAGDVPALRTQPYAALSAMDGYAIRFADLPGPFRRVGESAAGAPFEGAVGCGETVRIFTGAALPEGADTVLVQEEAAVDGDKVTLDGEGPPHVGRNVRQRGLDFTERDVLVRAGERIIAARIALAATAGHDTLPVRRRLRVATFATGDELVEPGSAAADTDLPESNRAMLAALLADWPVEVIDLGILPDRLDAITEALRIAPADLVVTSGGASVGDHDLIRPAIEAAGGAIDFWRIALRPGKPMLAARLAPAPAEAGGERLVVGLPGNPVSAFVTAILFVRPLIAHWMGAADPLPQLRTAVLGESLPANDHREDYLRAATRGGRVWSAAIQDSSMLLTLARADCLIRRAPHAPAAAAGDLVEILPLA